MPHTLVERLIDGDQRQRLTNALRRCDANESSSRAFRSRARPRDVVDHQQVIAGSALDHHDRTWALQRSASGRLERNRLDSLAHLAYFASLVSRAV